MRKVYLLAMAMFMVGQALPALADVECIETPLGQICFDTGGANTVTQSNSASQSTDCSDPDCTSSSTVTQSNN